MQIEIAMRRNAPMKFGIVCADACVKFSMSPENKVHTSGTRRKNKPPRQANFAKYKDTSQPLKKWLMENEIFSWQKIKIRKDDMIFADANGAGLWCAFKQKWQTIVGFFCADTCLNGEGERVY